MVIKYMKVKNSGKNKIVRRDDKFSSAQFYIQYGVDIERRRITLDEDIDEFSTGFSIRGIHKMIDEDPTGPIDIYINSYGGSVYDGLALYDTLVALEEAEVRTHALGKVMSMGLIIFLAGDKRYSSPRSTFMAHSVSGGSDGKIYEIKDDVEESKRLNAILLQILADRTSMTLSWWRKQIEFRDRYYDAKQAEQYGILEEGDDDDQEEH